MTFIRNESYRKLCVDILIYDIYNLCINERGPALVDDSKLVFPTEWDNDSRYIGGYFCYMKQI